MRALCCPDKFRGSLSAPEAATRMAAGLRRAGFATRELPLGDGGEGTLDVLLAGGGERRRTVVTGPLGDPVEAEWGLLRTGTAVIEMARAAGLGLVAGRNDPVRATTAGVGELIAAAAAAGAREALVCVGGSATTDGGLGAVEALGWSLHDLSVVVACDVDTRFRDAAAVFAPQKGATPDQIVALTGRLERLETLYAERTGVDVASLAGAGAAGGLAGGLAALGATLRSGFEVVAHAAGLDAALAGVDVVLSGEGRLDATSFGGKVVGGVLARVPAGVRIALVAGEVTADARASLPAGVLAASLLERTRSLEHAMARAARLVEQAAYELGRDLAAAAGAAGAASKPGTTSPLGGGT
jgi:glycerate kinase